MMGMGKTLIVGNALECKGKEKVPKPKLNVGKRNVQKDKEVVDYMESDVVTSYIEDASLVIR